MDYLTIFGFGASFVALIGLFVYYQSIDAELRQAKEETRKFRDSRHSIFEVITSP